MPSRREFIKNAAGALAGIAFTGCSLLGAPLAQAQSKPAARRREVVINGRRVKTIDVHSHCVIPEAMALTGLKLTDAVKGQREQVIVVQDRLRAMDEQGIDVEALSINPSGTGRSATSRARSSRFRTRSSPSCARRIRTASSLLHRWRCSFRTSPSSSSKKASRSSGLRGAAIGGSVAGEEFSNPKFHPVWAKAEELGVLLFIHPQSTPELANRFKGNGWLSNTIGNPLDTTIALSHLIFEGTLDKFPGLKVCAAHGGGYLPSYAPRSDHSCFVSPAGCDPKIVLKKKPTEYLKQMYFDSLVFTSEALRHLAAQVGTSQIVMGTDHPIPWQSEAVDHILNTPSLSDAERVAILGETAAKLLGIKL